MNDPIRQIRMLADDLVEAPVGRDDRIVFREGEREIETVAAQRNRSLAPEAPRAGLPDARLPSTVRASPRAGLMRRAGALFGAA